MTDIDLKQLRELQDDVGEWSAENFGKSPVHGGDGSPPDHALIGIGEELGELTRPVLKRAQGIDDDDKYADRDDVGVEAERDAVGDVMIYLMDCLHRSGHDSYVADGLPLSIAENGRPPIETPVQAIRMAYTEYGTLCSMSLSLMEETTAERRAGELANVLWRFCEIRGYDFERCIQDAWEEVSGREWDANP